jgi:hypothetical protein
MKSSSLKNRNFDPYSPYLRHLLYPLLGLAIFQITRNSVCHRNSQYNALMKPSKMPLSSQVKQRIANTNVFQTKADGLHALLETPPKWAVIKSRETVRTNKSDILKALRRGHRVEDIAQALSIPMRTFVRRLKELNIAARLVRKQYQRSE